MLVSQAEFGRRRNISREAVRKRTVTAGGPIPVHGPRKLIDVAEADTLWDATKTPQGEGGATSGGAPPWSVARGDGRGLGADPIEHQKRPSRAVVAVVGSARSFLFLVAPRTFPCQGRMVTVEGRGL